MDLGDPETDALCRFRVGGPSSVSGSRCWASWSWGSCCGAAFGLTPISELAGCTFSSTHLRISESAPRSRLRSDSRCRAMLSTSVASSVRVASSRVDLLAELLVRLGLELCRSRLGCGDGGPRRLLGLGDHRGRLRLAFPLRLVDELLCQEEGALQRLVGEGIGLGRSGCRCRCRGDPLFAVGRGRRRPLLAFELRDALTGLAQPLVQLADVVLEGFGFLGRLVQVLIDLVDVVALQPQAEFHGAERVEDG